jgi:Carboxypeptidase regulatory-like domain
MPRAIPESVMCLALCIVLASLSRAQTASPAESNIQSQKPESQKPESQEPESLKLTVAVTDENALVVPGARVELTKPQFANPLRCETNFAGRCEFGGLSPGTYEVRVEKIGFYAALLPSVQAGTVPEVDVSLGRVREVREVVDVTESPPAIDLGQISSKEELTGAEILDIPYPGPHDYHNALNFIPGVTPDSFGLLHVAGAEGYQTLVLLDGFNVSQPTNGELSVRTSIESFRSMQVVPSRESAEFGKGSGGVLSMNTAMGNDRFRFTSTDFLPGPGIAKGGQVDGEWTPIETVSGPIIKGKMWFIDALDGEFDANVDTQLQPSPDRDYVWRVDNLAKVQANLTSRNIVIASFLSNYYHDEYAGLGFLVPQPATPVESETAYFGSLKDQYYFHNGALLEAGFGVDQYGRVLTPRGDAPYIELFFSAAGNYYLHENASARREQGIWNLFLPPQQWLGRHDIKVGADVDRLNYDAEFLRQPISFEQQGAPAPGQTVEPCATGANGVPVPPYICTRYSTFSGGNYAPAYNTEGSGYVEDRWLITNRLLVEPGVRLDWDQLVRTPLVSPRLAGTFRLDKEGTTKVSAGIGIVYDTTNLGLIHQPLEGQRTDYFFQCVATATAACATTEPTDVNGNATPEPVPVQTTFVVDRNTLQAPRYINSSASLEKKLPYAIFLKLEGLDKRGTHAFAYNTLNGAVDGEYLLGNGRDDRYDSITLSLRHHFGGRYEVFGAYTRSSSRSNQIFDFSLDIPLLSPQLPGPYGWDTPNRFVGWGMLPGFKLPLIHKFDIVYSAEARTGLPFYGTTDQGEIAPGYAPGSSLRFPVYYSLNLQFQKRIHLFARNWDVRAGFNNITNHANVSGADATIDATHPLPTFVDGEGRAFAFEMRLLGRS